MEFSETKPLAYFSAEYALFDCSQLYAGGLGILAGDYFLELAEKNFAAVAIGLFYHKAHIASDNPHFKAKTPEEMGLSHVVGKEGQQLVLLLPIEGRTVCFKVWKYTKNKATLFLLDTFVSQNTEEDKAICDLLYAENRDTRMKQEILLGIGGMKLIETLGLDPAVYHLNEGHSAFMACELIAQHGLEAARKKIVFTNHTLIIAGNERFAVDAVKKILGMYVEDSHINMNELLSLGREEQADLFSMTNFALTVASRINAVSKIHAEKAAEMWHAPHASVEYVTNGVYIPRWDMLKADSVEAISSSHQKNKQLLIEEIRKRSGVVFDAGTLLIGWARRLVEYKQPMALFSDIARLQKLASNNKNGFNMVISGPVNAEMMRSNEYIQRLVELSQNELKGRLVFLPEYDIDLSKLLVSGTDVWLNTPMVGKEACGTSGMKACLNGSLPLSTNDGWIAETNISNIGWLADDSRLGNDLLDHIEHEIAPLFYENQNEWLLRMSRSRKLITDRFGADRLLKDYEKKMYDPLLNI